MRNWGSKRQKKGRIEIIPMIDVMMFLLVFFVLLSLNVIPGFGLQTRQPSSSFTSAIPPDSKRVVVTLSRERVAVDGSDALPGRVAALVGEKAHGDRSARIIVNADKAVEVQQMIDVMDELRGDGWHSIYLSALKKH